MVMVVNTGPGLNREALDVPRVYMTKRAKSRPPEHILSLRKDLINENVGGDLAKSDKFIRRRREAHCNNCQCVSVRPGASIMDCSRTKPSSCRDECERRIWWRG